MKKQPCIRPRSPAIGVSVLALFVALGGASYAAASLPANSVGTAQIKSKAVTPPKLAPQTLSLLRPHIATKGPLTGDGRATNPVALPEASASHDGYLSSGDWSAFNGKSTVNVVTTPDTRSGCPLNAVAGSDLLTQTLDLPTGATVFVTAHMASLYNGRRDLDLLVNGNLVTIGIGFTDTEQWTDATVHWGGTLNSGTNTISLQGSVANAYGCGSQYGDITTLVIR